MRNTIFNMILVHPNPIFLRLNLTITCLSEEPDDGSRGARNGYVLREPPDSAGEFTERLPDMAGSGKHFPAAEPQTSEDETSASSADESDDEPDQSKEKERLHILEAAGLVVHHGHDKTPRRRPPPPRPRTSSLHSVQASASDALSGASPLATVDDAYARWQSVQIARGQRSSLAQGSEDDDTGNAESALSPQPSAGVMPTTDSPVISDGTKLDVGKVGVFFSADCTWWRSWQYPVQTPPSHCVRLHQLGHRGRHMRSAICLPLSVLTCIRNNAITVTRRHS